MDQLLVRQIAEARRAPDTVVLEGVHALKHALRFGAEVELALTPDRTGTRALLDDLAPDVAAVADTLLAEVDAETWRALVPRGLPSPALAVARRPVVSVPGILDRRRAPIVLLEEPRHLGNLGAVIRVAAAADADGVLTTGRSDPWHPRCIRGAAGLQFAVPTATVADLPTGPRPLVAFDPEGPPAGPDVVPPDAILAFGTERDGLSASLRDRADHTVGIPMRSGVSSLNLATSVAVALYAVRSPTAHRDTTTG